ncbi:MAG: heavy metal translocating P-type ATPase [Planctomycetota bacterium]
MLVIAGAIALTAEVVALARDDERSWLVFGLAATAILVAGVPTLRGALRSLLLLRLGIDLLMAIAVIGAFAIGEYPEAAVVVVLFAIAERIEARSLARAGDAVRGLMTMTPDTAIVATGDGSWQERPVAEVMSGAAILVRPGARIPLDGVVTRGASSVDQAPITGESRPVDKEVGDKVFAGTVNGTGSLEIRTTGGKDETTLARIVHGIQEAQAQRAPTQRFVDAFARVYTPIVVVIAVLVAILPWAAFGAPFQPWLYQALVLLVIACPCALVISTPVAIVSGLTAAARAGILVKGGVHLERGATLALVAMDKTGTITEGKPVLTDVDPLGTMDRDEALRTAASIDAPSEHPVARAITAGWSGPLLAVDDFTAILGRGARAQIGGQQYLLGNHRLAEETGVCSPAIEASLAKLEQQGKTALVLMTRERAHAILAVADQPRASSVQAIADLSALRVHTIMLSGDNRATAATIAKRVGIEDARGDMLPEDKLRAIGELRAAHRVVGMVGDGINDGPALAAADIGFAMGAAGTDTALETADVALMQDDLRGVARFVVLSRRTKAVLRQNITVALVTKGAFFGLALAGLATLWSAVIADMGASLVVVANSLRLLRPSLLSRLPVADFTPRRTVTAEARDDRS